jgi:hypothetical protein
MIQFLLTPALILAVQTLAQVPSTKPGRVATKPPPAKAKTYDLGRDYSLAANPNGLWSYGFWLEDNVFHPLTGSEITPDDLGRPAEVWFNPDDRGIAVFHNPNDFALISNGGDGVHPPDSVWVDPPQSDQGVVTGVVSARFTVPEKGIYKIEATFDKVLDQVGNLVVVSVLVNQHDQFSAFLDPNSPPARLNRKFRLEAGDVVDFAVLDFGDGDFGDTVFIQATLIRLKK